MLLLLRRRPRGHAPCDRSFCYIAAGLQGWWLCVESLGCSFFRVRWLAPDRIRQSAEAGAAMTSTAGPPASDVISYVIRVCYVAPSSRLRSFLFWLCFTTSSTPRVCPLAGSGSITSTPGTGILHRGYYTYSQKKNSKVDRLERRCGSQTTLLLFMPLQMPFLYLLELREVTCNRSSDSYPH